MNLHVRRQFAATLLLIVGVFTCTRFLVGCGSRDEARLRGEIDSTIKLIRTEYHGGSGTSSSVIDPMDAQCLAILGKATPASVERPALAGAGVQHTKFRGARTDTIFVLWICAQPVVDGVEIKAAKSGERFFVPLSRADLAGTHEEARAGNLRLSMAYRSDYGAPPELLPALRHPNGYDLALCVGGKVVSGWVPILEGTSAGAERP